MVSSFTARLIKQAFYSRIPQRPQERKEGWHKYACHVNCHWVDLQDKSQTTTAHHVLMKTNSRSESFVNSQLTSSCLRGPVTYQGCGAWGETKASFTSSLTVIMETQADLINFIYRAAPNEASPARTGLKMCFNGSRAKKNKKDSISLVDGNRTVLGGLNEDGWFPRDVQRPPSDLPLSFCAHKTCPQMTWSLLPSDGCLPSTGVVLALS